MDLRDWTNQPRGPDGKWGSGGGTGTLTAAQAEWVAKGEAAWAKHHAAKAAGKPSLASYYKKLATQADAKAGAAKTGAPKASEPKSEGPKLVTPKTVTIKIAPAGAIDAEHAKLLAKHAEAKAAGKPSLASYYKKKAADYAAKAGAGAPAAPANLAKSYQELQGEAMEALKTYNKAAQAGASKKVLQDLTADLKAKQELADNHPDKPDFLARKPAASSSSADKALLALQEKYEAAKAQGKLSMAYYWKKKIAAHEASAEASKVSAPEAAPAPAAAAPSDGSKPNPLFSGHYAPGSSTPDSVKSFVQEAMKTTPIAATEQDLNHSRTNAAFRDDEVKSAVIAYTGSVYSLINNALRGNRAMTPATANWIKAIDAAMQPIEKSVKVYRHSGSPKTFAGLKPGDIISDAGFHSTTITKNSFGAGSGKTTMHIMVPSGTKAAWVKPVSQHAHENELVLPRGQKYVVVSAPVIGGKHSDIQLMAIPDSVLPGVNTKEAHPDKPFQHTLRAALLALIARTQEELKDKP